MTLVLKFNHAFKEGILGEVKTETRRKITKVKVGELRYAQVEGHSPFASIRITHVYTEILGSIPRDSISREGFETFRDFMKAWIEIYGGWDPNLEIMVIRFNLVDNLLAVNDMQAAFHMITLVCEYCKRSLALVFDDDRSGVPDWSQCPDPQDCAKYRSGVPDWSSRAERLFAERLGQLSGEDHE